MEVQQVLDKLGALKDAATVDRVYGEPQTVGDRMVIPVAEVKTGMGFGFGHPKDGQDEQGEGGGGGGGVMAKPVGIVEVSPEGVEFIPIKTPMGGFALMLLGLALGMMFGAMGGQCKMLPWGKRHNGSES